MREIFAWISFLFWITVFVKGIQTVRGGCRPVPVSPSQTLKGCSNKHLARSVCTIECKPGFDKTGGGTRKVCWCTKSSCSWQGASPICEPSKCPHPDIYLENMKIVNDWKTGFAVLVEVDRPQMGYLSQWSMVVVFERPLGPKASLITWDARLISAASDKRTFTLANAVYNGRLKDNSRNVRILLIVTDVSPELPRSGFIGMYKKIVKDASCLVAPEFTSFQPLPSIIKPETEITSTTMVPTTAELTTIATLPPTTKPVTKKTTRRPMARRIPTRRTTTRRWRIWPTKMTATTTTSQPELKKINDRFCHLQTHAKPYSTESGWTDEGSPYFNGNAFVLPPVRIFDWEVVMVFNKAILAMEVWNCRVTGRSQSGYMWTFGALSWNTALNADIFDISFLAKQQPNALENPLALVYLCSKDFTNGDIVATGPNDKMYHELLQRPVSDIKITSTSTTPSTFAVITQQSSTKITTKIATTPKPIKMTPRCKPKAPTGIPVKNAGQTKPIVKPNNDKTKYNYDKLIYYSILFYDAQRAGVLPLRYRRIPWRGNSALKDGCQIGVDLSKGWYDAGDHVKFNFPMAASVTTLAWGGILFDDAYKASGEMQRFLGSIKWPVEYLLACHISKNELVGQIGDVETDHDYWGRPEQMKLDRPIFKIDQHNPGSDLAAETAAALASTSILFRGPYRLLAKKLIIHAEELFEFADKYRGMYHEAIPQAAAYYKSTSGYDDELLWSAAWLYKATKKTKYLAHARATYDKMRAMYYTGPMYSWDNKLVGAQVLLANLTGEDIFRNQVINFLDGMMEFRKTPQGMVYYDVWAPNKYAANIAFIALAASTLEPPLPKRDLYVAFGKKQTHLLLGDAGRSYVIGFGKNYPKKPHHRSSSCKPFPAKCDSVESYHSLAGNPYILYGALVGGPNEQGVYNDDRTEYRETEVSCDTNAGFQSAVAGLKHFTLIKPKTKKPIIKKWRRG